MPVLTPRKRISNCVQFLRTCFVTTSRPSSNRCNSSLNRFAASLSFRSLAACSLRTFSSSAKSACNLDLGCAGWMTNKQNGKGKVNRKVAPARGQTRSTYLTFLQAGILMNPPLANVSRVGLHFLSRTGRQFIGCKCHKTEYDCLTKQVARRKCQPPSPLPCPCMRKTRSHFIIPCELGYLLILCLDEIPVCAVGVTARASDQDQDVRSEVKKIKTKTRNTQLVFL